MITIRRKKIFQLIYIFYLVAFLVIIGSINYFKYRSYIVRALTPKPAEATIPAVKNVDNQTLLRLGFLDTRKDSSFIHFDLVKPDNTIRIGCFGDSYTFGSEVGKKQDYPFFLHNMFAHKQKRTAFEVLNFGSGWHGFHQAFMVWKYIGQKYDLDYILLGPECFQYNRDTRFNHTQDTNSYYLHARYILKHNQLKLVEVIGKTHQERMEHYYRFMPHYRYLRYDRETPAFLKCLLPPGRTLKNPFYYLGLTEKEEALATYSLLLSEMADTGKKIIVGHYHPTIVRLSRNLNRANVASFRMYRPLHFPYIARSTHNSPLGNQIVAQQMYEHITALQSDDIELLHNSDIELAPSPDRVDQKKSLSSYRAIYVELHGTTVASFVSLDQSTNNLFVRMKNSSVLSLKNRTTSILDSCFIPLNRDLFEGMKLKLRVFTKKGVKEYMLGVVKLVHPNLNIGVVSCEGLHFDNYREILALNRANSLIQESQIFQNKLEAHLVLDDILLLKSVRTRGTITLQPSPANTSGFMAIRSLGDSSIDQETLPESGTIKLTLVRTDRSVERYVIARYEKKRFNKLAKYELDLTN